MARNKKLPNQNARGALDSLMVDTTNDRGGRLNAGDNDAIKSKAEQTGSSMVDKMMADYEIKAENSGFASDNSSFSY